MITEDVVRSCHVYPLNVTGKAERAEEFVAASDDAAMTVTYRIARESAVELSRGLRMIARVPVIGRSPTTGSSS